MNCQIHPDREAVAACVRCGRLMCDECRTEVGVRSYCDSCLPWLVHRGERADRPVGKSPFIAFVLSMLPGLGHMYNGDMIMGTGVMAVFFLCIFMTAHFRPPVQYFFIIGIIVTWFFGLSDATAMAYKINRGETPMDRYAANGSGSQRDKVSLIWGWVLLGIGALFLLQNFGVAWQVLDDFLPIVPIALGVYLIARYYSTHNDGNGGEANDEAT
ncbi:MAG: hypothetical protein ACE5O2_14905 [Armatimonadota bacterium]